MGTEWEWKARGRGVAGESVITTGYCEDVGGVLTAINEETKAWKSVDGYTVTRIDWDVGENDGSTITRNLNLAVRGLRVMAEVPQKRRRHMKEAIAKHLVTAATVIDQTPRLGLEACAITLRDAAATWLRTDDADTVGKYRNKDLCNYVRGVLSVVRVSVGAACYPPWEN